MSTHFRRKKITSFSMHWQKETVVLKRQKRGERKEKREKKERREREFKKQF